MFSFSPAEPVGRASLQQEASFGIPRGFRGAQEASCAGPDGEKSPVSGALGPDWIGCPAPDQAVIPPSTRGRPGGRVRSPPETLAGSDAQLSQATTGCDMVTPAGRIAAVNAGAVGMGDGCRLRRDRALPARCPVRHTTSGIWAPSNSGLPVERFIR